MSDKNKNRKRLLTDFVRYHRNEMTREERNSFERELQKDPFAEEASEGFASISPEEAFKDIENLQRRLKTKTVRKQRFMVYRIAASIAVLMMISTVFILIEKNKTVKQLADNSFQSETLEIVKSQPITEPAAKDVASEKPVVIEEKKTDKSVARQIRIETGKSEGTVERIKIAEIRKNDSISELKAKSVEAYIAEERMAAKADSQAQVSLDPSISALSEVVIVGYGVKGDESDKEDVQTGFVPPQPVNGKSNFDKYIKENLHRPDTATAGQRVVVVISFLVRTNGSVDSIRIVRSPGKLFSDEVIRLIKSGPSWKPAEENGKKIEDEVRLRIVFR